MPALLYFNPEHDLALAAGRAAYTPPAVCRQLRRARGGVMACVARAGDVVAVDDDAALLVAARCYARAGVRFVPWVRLAAEVDFATLDAVRPWGWDAVVRGQLRRAGVPERLLPSDADLAAWRAASHRGWAAQHVLPAVRAAVHDTVGEARGMDALEALSDTGEWVLKSPWSCSGRGVRVWRGAAADDADNVRRWARRVLAQQGSLMIEPYYNKVCDFAMEFWREADGAVRYCGLSVFETRGAAYVANTAATEQEKCAAISRHVAAATLCAVRIALQDVLARRLPAGYCGPLGIDMMAVRQADGTVRCHPCVEMNLRCTMGHVALPR